MPDVDLSLSFSSFFVLIGVVISAGIAFLSYRRTIPPLSGTQKWTIGSLRFLSLSLLSLLLGKPVLFLLFRTVIPPSTIVLLDNSASMTLGDSIRPRNQISGVLESDDLAVLKREGTVRLFVFDQDVREMDDGSLDSVTYAGEQTDLAGGFDWLRRTEPVENARAILLLTDGNPTTPIQPAYSAEELGIPVFAVGVGDTAVRRDLVVGDILTNSIAYAGSRVPVQVTIRSSGFEENEAEVRLLLSGKTADQSTIHIGSGVGEQRTTLFFSPDSAGFVRGEVRVTRFEGEVTWRNNAASFSLRVLSGKRKILLLAGFPGEDVAFLRRSLASDSNTTVTMRVENRTGGFFEGDLTEQHLREADALFLAGLPGPATAQRTIQLLRRDDVRRKPIFVMLSRFTTPEMLRRMGDAIPFSIQGLLPQEQVSFISVEEGMRLHPLLRVTGEGTWSSLPPVFALRANVIVAPDALVLASTRAQSTVAPEPMIVVRKTAGVRVIGVAAYGLWRWKMLSPEASLPANPYDEFIGNAVRWLTAVDDERRFRAAPVRESFSALEPPMFRAEVYDESMRPLDEAVVYLDIAGPGRAFRTELSPVDNGQYEVSLDLLPPGSYSYSASAVSDSRPIGSDKGTFEVGGLHAEYLETRLNRDLLRALAYRTGGAYFDSPDISGLSDSILASTGWKSRERLDATQVELWYNPWVLGALIALFSLEWLLRKRHGLL